VVIHLDLSFHAGVLAWRRHRRASAWPLSTGHDVVVLMLTRDAVALLRNYSAFGVSFRFAAVLVMVLPGAGEGNTGEPHPISIPIGATPPTRHRGWSNNEGSVEMVMWGKRRMCAIFCGDIPASFSAHADGFTLTWLGSVVRADYLAENPLRLPNIGFSYDR